MKQKTARNPGWSASIISLGAWVLAGGRKLAQVTGNAKAGGWDLETAELMPLSKEVLALGEPAKASFLN